MEILNKASHKLAEAMYKQASTADPQNAGPDASQADGAETSNDAQDDVVEAEFEETDK